MAIHIHLRAQKATPVRDKSFIEILNAPDSRELVDVIEDTIASLKGKKGDTRLEEVLARQKAELQRRFGYRWVDAGSFGLKEVSKAQLEQKFRNGEWEAVSELRSGKQEVRNVSTKKQFTVAIKDAGFSNAEYDPREVARLRDKIKEVKQRIAQSKTDIQRKGLERTLVNYENELKKYRSDDSVKDSRDYLQEAETASKVANTKTKEATSKGSPDNHAKASVSHYAAGMSWSNVANSSTDPNEKEAARKKSEEHRRQSDFHHKNSLA